MRKLLCMAIGTFSFLSSFAQPIPGPQYQYVGNYQDEIIRGKFQLVPPDPAIPSGTLSSGAAWDVNTVDFTRDFEINYKLRTNTPTGGSYGDGHVVVFGSRITGTAVNTGGGALGYHDLQGAINPDFEKSIGIEFDYFVNTAWNDHVNGGGSGKHVMTVQDANPYNQIGNNGPNYNSNFNDIDGIYSDYKVKWDCQTQLLTTHINGVEVDRADLSTSPQTPADLFDDPANVFWGFTASRGGVAWSEFEFKDVYMQQDDVCHGCVDPEVSIKFGTCIYRTSQGTLRFPVDFDIIFAGAVPNVSYHGFDINFGDGVFQSFGSSTYSVYHEYGLPGRYEVMITMYGYNEVTQTVCSENMIAYIVVPDCPIIGSGGGGGQSGGGNMGQGKAGKTTSVDNISTNNNTMVFPNPTNGIIHVNIGSRQIASVSVTDLTGKVIVQKDRLTSQKTTLDIQNMPNGIYMIRITDTNGNIERQRIILQKK